MSITAYDGVFLAPESIVICPALPAFAFEVTPADSPADRVNDDGPREAAFGPAGSAHEIV